MRKRGLDQPPADMVALRERVEEWRHTRSGLCAMPADLWAVATEIATRRGVYATAKGVGVEFGALARRVKENAQSKGQDVAFVEWSGAEILGKKAAAGTPTGTLVEISDSTGRQMTVRLATGERVDVAGLVAAFCRSHQ